MLDYSADRHRCGAGKRIRRADFCTCVLRIHRFLSSVQLSRLFILDSTANSEVTYLFLHSNIILASPILYPPTLPQISPTSIQSPIPLTAAHLPLPTQHPLHLSAPARKRLKAPTGTCYSESSHAFFLRVFYEYCAPGEVTRIYSVLTTCFWTPLRIEMHTGADL